MIELFLAGTLSGVGCSSPVGWASTGMGPGKLTWRPELKEEKLPTSAHAAALLGHLIVPGVEVLLTLAQPLLQEGGLASAPRPTSESCEIKVQLLEGNETCKVSMHFCAKAKS